MGGLARVCMFARLIGPGLGDLVQRNIALSFLRRAHPEATVTLVVGADLERRFRTLLTGHTYATDVLVAPASDDEDPGSWRRFLATLAAGRFELCVIDPGSRGLDAEHAFAVGIPRRIGVAGGPDAAWLSRPLPLPDPVFGAPDLFDYARALAAALDLPPPAAAEVLPPLPRPEPASTAPPRPTVGSARPRVAVHPGGAPHWNRRWPHDRYVDLCGRLVNRARAALFLLGDPPEAGDLDALAGEVRQRWSHARIEVVVGRDLGPTATVLAGVDLLVGNDSGLAHVAAAVRVPTVVIYGPTGTAFYWARVYPLHRAVSLNYPCQQIRHEVDELAGRRCEHLCRLPYETRSGPYPRCMTDLTVESVWAAVRAQLALPTRPRS